MFPLLFLLRYISKGNGNAAMVKAWITPCSSGTNKNGQIFIQLLLFINFILFQMSVKYDTKIPGLWLDNTSKRTNYWKILFAEWKPDWDLTKMLFSSTTWRSYNIFTQFGDGSKDVLSGWASLTQNAGSICANDKTLHADTGACRVEFHIVSFSLPDLSGTDTWLGPLETPMFTFSS